MHGLLLALFIVVSAVLLVDCHNNNWGRSGHFGHGYGGHHMGHHGYGAYRGGRMYAMGSDRRVDSRQAPRWAAGPICQDGLRRHYCYMNPCMGARCMSNPQHVCVPNYCGGCKRTWRDTDGEDVDCPINDVSFNRWGPPRQRAG